MRTSRLFLIAFLAVLAASVFFAQATDAQTADGQSRNNQVPKPPWASGGSATAKPDSHPAAPKENPPDNSASTIKVDVKLVNVFVTIEDEHGAPVAGLTKDNFQLKEDGKDQQIAVFSKESALPLSIVLDIDTSLSTRKNLPLELSSARRFVHDILRPVDALALYGVSEYVDETVPFTADLNRIDRGIDHMRMGSATALYDALYVGAQALDRRQGRKVLLAITDGGDTVSKVDYQGALRAAQEAEAIVYSIIIVPIAASAGRDTGGEHALIQLSADTGGRYFYATSLEEIDGAFRQISDELRTQYLLAYYPSERYSDSDYRRIQVAVSGPSASNYKVRHRTGYYTSRSEF